MSIRKKTSIVVSLAMLPTWLPHAVIADANASPGSVWSSVYTANISPSSFNTYLNQAETIERHRNQGFGVQQVINSVTTTAGVINNTSIGDNSPYANVIVDATSSNTGDLDGSVRVLNSEVEPTTNIDRE